ncbi:RHS repeat-associated core domain-containing protein, partial [Pseudomonas syringae group genomosp. 3]
KTETMANSQVEVTSSYQYDSLGRRVGKQSDIQGQTDQKRFLWQGLRMLREESPEQSSLYLYEPGSYAPLARVDQKEGETENTIYYYHTDQIGTPLEMTDAEGHIVWQAKYAPWGLIKQLVVNEVEQNLRFQGQYFDVETGLHYNTFRYYDPEIGRFITQDPIGLSGGDNLYLYAPNPYGWVDPWGLCNSSSGGATATEPLKALPAPRQIEASWGSNTYKQGGLMTGMANNTSKPGGLMTGIEHVFYRHGPNSGFSNTSKFSAGTSVKDVSNYVDSALRYGKVTPNGPGGYVVEHNVGKTIGIDVSGKSTSVIKINVRNGIIHTAFPK